MRKRKEELEIWLADGPEIDEIIEYITGLYAEIRKLRCHISKSDLYQIDYELMRECEGGSEIDIRREWSNEIATLNLIWAKKLAKHKQELLDDRN